MIGSKLVGQTIWITGLSGSGKTTLAKEVVFRLKQQGRVVLLLDGDELRKIFGAVTFNPSNYNKKSRLDLAMKYANLCKVISSQGISLVVATISLFHEVQEWNRANLLDYFEVYLKVPIEELRKRDYKGIYRSYDAGKLTNVPGLDLTIEEPKSADMVVEFIPHRNVSSLADELIQTLKKRKKY